MAPLRRRRWPWVLLGVALAAALCAASGAAFVVYRYARAVDAGEVSPSAAVNSWVLTFNHDPDETAGITRLLVASRRQALLRQRADYINAMRRDIRKHDWLPVRFTTNGGADDTERIHGDRADVTEWFGTLAFDPDHAGLMFGGAAYPWRFQARRQGGSWRVESFMPPDWCNTYSSCDRARSDPTPTSTPTTDSPRPSGGPCVGIDPLRPLRSCPPTADVPSNR